MLSSKLLVSVRAPCCIRVAEDYLLGRIWVRPCYSIGSDGSSKLSRSATMTSSDIFKLLDPQWRWYCMSASYCTHSPGPVPWHHAHNQQQLPAISQILHRFRAPDELKLFRVSICAPQSALRNTLQVICLADALHRLQSFRRHDIINYAHHIGSDPNSSPTRIRPNKKLTRVAP